MDRCDIISLSLAYLSIPLGILFISFHNPIYDKFLIIGGIMYFIFIVIQHESSNILQG
jgi:hypothetical protein